MSQATPACRAALLQLLQAALWGSVPCARAFDRLTASDWEGVFQASQVQAVTALACQGLSLLPDECYPDDALLARWMASVARVERHSRHMNEVLLTLLEFFSRHGLQPVVLKGQGIARLYSHPLLRECGDIDLYFLLPGQGRDALRVLREAGTRPQRKPDGSYLYAWQGVPVEHHPRITDLASPLARRHVAAMESLFPCQSVSLGMGHEAQVTVPSPTLSLLLQTAHVLKHALGWGTGLRQMADMAVTLHAQHGQIDGHAYRHACSLAHILRWNALLHGFLTQCLALPLECLPYGDRLCDSRPLQERVWRDGNFGQARSRHALEASPGWAGKCRTALSLLGHVRFGMAYAPVETLLTSLSLASGQFALDK